MMTALRGLSGSLLPERFLSETFRSGVARWLGAREPAGLRRRFEAWWAMVDADCGPATGVRALFNLVAMPLFALLGFRARAARFDGPRAQAQLQTPRSTTVPMILLPWAVEPSSVWREAARAAHAAGADWCFVLAPPFLSLVDARGHAVRQSVDVAFPDVLEESTFAAFLSVCHASAFDPVLAATPQPGGPSARDSHLDALVRAGHSFQDRVRADLQDGVFTALASIVSALERDRRTDAADRFDSALTLVYRVLFLLFAESRDLVPRRHPIYRGAYAIETLCRDALQPGEPAGLWEGFAAITRLSRAGCRMDDLDIRPFNGRLFARAAAPALEAHPARRAGRGASRDAALRTALVALATRRGVAGREAISYADLGVEQLGAVYERVLDLDPAQPRAWTRTARVHSQRRKQSGTFYTPQPLADFLVRRTLAPLVSGAGADDILALRVVDPAMGSGAFLVSACRFLAHAYELALIDEGRCSAADFDAEARADIRRRIAERCLMGVDVNPTAVQVARLSLWLTTLARGKPLSFLDHRLRSGNSLLGAAPDDLRRTPGARRTSAAGTHPLFADLDLEDRLRGTTRPLLELGARRDDTVADVHAKEAMWRRLSGDRSPIRPWQLAASLWMSRWFWPADGSGGPPPSPAELRAAIDAVIKGDSTVPGGPLARWLSVARALQTSLGFFHWPLEFADIFYDEHGQPRPNPGFDAVIGNPPWEMLRGRTADPSSSSFIRFMRESGLYPSCDRGHVNLYQPFLDRALTLVRPGGRIGLIVPFGLATDEGAASLRARLLDRAGLDTIVGIDNARGLFPIHRGLRFVAVVAQNGGPARDIRARFGVAAREEIESLPDSTSTTRTDADAYPVRFTPEGLRRIGGSARRIPDCRRPRDLAVLERLAREYPPLGSAAGWGVEFGRELNATDNRQAFGSRGLPVIEGKHIRPFAALPGDASIRIERAAAAARLPARPFERARLAYRDVSGVGNRLTLIAAIVPAEVVTTHTLFCLQTLLPLERQFYLCGLFNSYVLNAIVRMLMGGHMTTALVESLPVPAWRGLAQERRLARLARRLSAGRHSPAVHAELQAVAARLYQVTTDEFRGLLEGFPLVPAADKALVMRHLAGRKRAQGRRATAL